VNYGARGQTLAAELPFAPVAGGGAFFCTYLYKREGKPLSARAEHRETRSPLELKIDAQGGHADHARAIGQVRGHFRRMMIRQKKA